MIGYYVHHHGQGHLSRALAVAAASDEPVVALTSLPRPGGSVFDDWVALPPDPALTDPLDAHGGGAVHWAPLNSGGFRERMQVVAQWVADARPRLVVVDVSVEVTALVRLLGVPVVVVAGPGERTDDAHVLGYRLATRILAPWPRFDPGTAAAGPFAAKTVWTGAFSRFDDRVPTAPEGRRQVLLLLGAGGSDLRDTELAEARAATAAWTWTALGADGSWRPDVWDDLLAADVVVAHAGASSLAEIAAARRPAIVLPQDRPFGEQRATARHLAAAGLATVLDTWPAGDEWPALLATAVQRGGHDWPRWNDGQGARRFVKALPDV